MRNIDFLLFQVIKKYDIYRCQPELERIYAKLCVQYCMNELFDTFSKDKKVALRTVGKYTEKILDVLTEENKEKIIGILKEELKKDRSKTEVLGFTKLNQTKVFPDNASIRGSLFHIRHLVKVEEV